MMYFVWDGQIGLWEMEGVAVGGGRARTEELPTAISQQPLPYARCRLQPHQLGSQTDAAVEAEPLYVSAVRLSVVTVGGSDGDGVVASRC